MKVMPFISFIFLTLFIFTLSTMGQSRLSFGIKSGANLSNIISLRESPNVATPIVYSHPFGFNFGLFIENKLGKKFSIVNEFLYQNNSSKITIYTGYEGVLDQTITIQYFIFPVLLKYQTSWLWDTYFIGGPSFGYIINANYKFYDQIYYDDGNVDVTKNFPAISTSIKLGIGKQIDFLSSKFNLELQTSWD